MSGSPLFGIIPAGQSLITYPSSNPSPTSLLYALPATKPFSHIVVFLLPGVALPIDTAAAIYIANDFSQQQPNFRFLGAIGPGKESAVFKVSSPGSGSGSGSGLVIGISVEPADTVNQKLQETPSSTTTSTLSPQPSRMSTVELAQRIIQNAFNFLASFSGTAGPGGVEVVPLKAFEEWWRKFESRVRSDPSFLEKQSE